MIRDVTIADAGQISAIYNHYVHHTIITFEEEPVSSAVMKGRIQEVIPHFPYLIWEEGGMILGYAYAANWKRRSAYRHSMECTIYLKNGHTGRGIGRQLYERLFSELRQQDYHVVIGGISLPNAASVALHEALGFEKVAHFREVGFKFGRWIDVGYWELIL